MEHWLLIDGTDLVDRAGAEAPRGLYAGTGWRATAVAAISELHQVAYILEPEHIVAAFDDGAPEFRRKLWPSYPICGTDQQEASERDRAAQAVRKLLPRLGVPVLRYAAHEADDLLTELARQLKAAELRVTVATSDRRLWQVLRWGVELYDVEARKSVASKDIQQLFAITPLELPLFIALTGEPAKRLPGVPVMTPEGASRILAKGQGLNNWLSLGTSIGQLEWLAAELRSAGNDPPYTLAADETALLANYELVQTALALVDLTETAAPCVKRVLLRDSSRASGLDRPAFKRAAQHLGVWKALKRIPGFFTPFAHANVGQLR